MFLMMIDIELSELENKYIDSFQQEENRATILSLSMHFGTKICTKE